MYEFMSDIKKVDLGAGGELYVYIYMGLAMWEYLVFTNCEYSVLPQESRSIPQDWMTGPSVENNNESLPGSQTNIFNRL